MDTGAPFSPTFWNRESLAGLTDACLDPVQLGSQYTPVFFVSLRSYPFLRSNQGAIFTLLRQMPGNLRGFALMVNNSAQYISPSIGGVTFRAMGSLAEGGHGRTVHAGAEYAGDRLWAGVSVDRTKVTGAAARLQVVTADNTAVAAGLNYRSDIGSGACPLSP